MGEELKAQDCELEYWNQQAEDYALVQIPCEDLRSIISRAWEAPAFNSTITALEAERNRAQLACQQITERLTAAEARAAAAEERVKYLQIIINCVVANCEASASSYQERIETIHRVTSALALEWDGDRTLKGTPDGR